jgi:hypothetical protein
MAAHERNLNALERQLLKTLVQFHRQQGLQSQGYLDPDTGGIYEHNLATLIGRQLRGTETPVDVLEACYSLEARGLAQRNRRDPNFDGWGIRPTQAGIDLVDYWVLPRQAKVLRWVKQNWQWLVTTATLALRGGQG